MISTQDLTQHIATLLDRAEGASRVIVFHERGEVIAPDNLDVHGLACRVVKASSELAIRAALLDFEEAGAQEVLVVITPLRREDIALDVQGRLMQRRLFRFDPWDAVRSIFRASEVAPRLRECQALGRALLRSSARINYAPSVASPMGERYAWEQLLHHEFGVHGPIHEVSTWLKWALKQPDRVVALLQDGELCAELRIALERLGARLATRVAELLERDAATPHPARNMVVGALMIRALREAQQHAAHQQLAYQARGALLGVLSWRGGLSLLDELEPLCEEVEAVCGALRSEAPEVARWVSDAVDRCFEELGVIPLAQYSRVSRHGWQELLKLTAQALIDGDLRQVEALIARHGAHSVAADDAELMRHLVALQRLAALCASEPPDAQADPAQLARHYIEQGSFEDMLRAELATADLGAQLQRANRHILDALHARRDGLNARFAKKFVAQLEQSGAASVPGTLPIQRVLSEVVAPLVTRQATLVIVLDGLSWGVMRALLDDPLLDRFWTPWVPHHRGEVLWPMVAALPSVTALSRHALLTGRMDRGDQGSEARGFAAHPQLNAAAARHEAPILFHKAAIDAQGVGGLGEQVKAAILSPKRRVVGVVVNAIDDQLDGAEQLTLRWSVERIAPLRTLLELASVSNRLVVMVGDHGHIWEDRTESLAHVHGTSARYRVDGGPATEREVVVRSPMARALSGQDEVIVPYGERVRYTARHRGYHGGASLQEVVTPLVVLSAVEGEDLSMGLPLQQLVTSPPAWWHGETRARPRLELPASLAMRIQPHPSSSPHSPDASAVMQAPSPAPSPQLDLLAPAPQRVEPVGHSSAPGDAATGDGGGSAERLSRDVEERRAPEEQLVKIVEALLNSRIYVAQAERSPTIQQSQESVFLILLTLLEQGDRTTDEALAAQIKRAGSRTRRLISAMQPVLNVEGYPILTYERGEGVVQLDRALLYEQFELVV